jgi:hypothetical protein
LNTGLESVLTVCDAVELVESDRVAVTLPIAGEHILHELGNARRA